MESLKLNSLKNTRVLVTVGVLVALNLILNFTRIKVSQSIEINFDFLAILMIAYLFGPGVAAVSAGFADIIGFLLSPSGIFFPGFTLNAILIGLIFGFGLYQKRVTILRLVSVFAIKALVISLILTPLWLKILYGTELIAVPRLIRTAILFPLDITLAYILIQFMDKYLSKKSFVRR